MAGLLDYENETNPLNMMLVLGGLGMMGAQNPAQGFGQGAAQGLLNYQQGQDKRRELEMLREKMRMQAAEAERQNLLTDAQISHYQALNNKAAQGPDPYYQVMETSNGLYRFNARTGEYEPLLANDKPLMRSTSDPVRQGEIAGQKSGNTYADFETPEGQKFRGKNGDFGLTADALLPGLINAESGGNPNAVSPKGAFGLTQIMPETAKNPGYGVQPMQNNTPEEQVRFGRDYLQAMIDANGGDVQKGLSAYNQGQGNLQRNGVTNQGYVNKVLGIGPSLDRKQAAETQGAKDREVNKANVDIDKATTQNSIDANRSANFQQEIIDRAYRYLYPEDETGNVSVKRDKNGRLIPPDKRMIYGASPADRIRSTMYDFSNINDSMGTNTKGLRRLTNEMVMAATGGKLGAGVSNADIEFLKAQQGVIDGAQNVNEIYDAFANIEDRIKQIKSRGGNVPSDPLLKVEQQNKPGGIDSLLNKYGIK